MIDPAYLLPTPPDALNRNTGPLSVSYTAHCRIRAFVAPVSPSTHPTSPLEVLELQLLATSAGYPSLLHRFKSDLFMENSILDRRK